MWGKREGSANGAYEEYEGYKMAFAFSGALSEEDLEVAKYGIAFMKNRLKPEIKEGINISWEYQEGADCETYFIAGGDED